MCTFLTHGFFFYAEVFEKQSHSDSISCPFPNERKLLFKECLCVLCLFWSTMGKKGSVSKPGIFTSKCCFPKFSLFLLFSSRFSFFRFIFLVVEKEFVFRGRLENVGRASIRSLLLPKKTNLKCK